jgi:phosphate butyryltransferase
MAGMILGAKVPIVLTSRGATSEEKFLSILISASACNE